MAPGLYFFIMQLYCAWFQCEIGSRPPFTFTNQSNRRPIVRALVRTGRSNNERSSIGPVVFSPAGVVEGYKMNISTREIYAFTGVPYGEVPVRFSAPVPRKPWKGVLQAKHPSPFCVQTSPASMYQSRGQEDCLFLDIYTPKIPNKSQGSLIPVLVWVPGGGFIFGRSETYGPAYFLREDIIFIVLNVRQGVFGFLATGNAAAPGNFALKDQSLAIKWVYDNVAAFGGDKNRIVIGGSSSSGFTAHLMLFTDHVTKNYISGIYSVSGTAFTHSGLENSGRAEELSNIVAEAAGCPKSSANDTRKSMAMVECLRKIDPHILDGRQYAMTRLPAGPKLFGPTIEPKLPGAFITELPEVLYERGEVPPIPLISTRTEDEFNILLTAIRISSPYLRIQWKNIVPKLLRLGYRHQHGRLATPEEKQKSLTKVTQHYFNSTNPPNLWIAGQAVRFIKMFQDNVFNAPMWKAVEYHHTVAPTYTYIMKQKTLVKIAPTTRFLVSPEMGASHIEEIPLLINNTKVIPDLAPGSDLEIASKNLINLIVNFATYGKPLYRTPKGKLLELWKPVTDMRNPIALEVGLVHNIKMIRDPIAESGMLKIWENVIF